MGGQLDMGGGDEEADYIVGGGGKPPLRGCLINRIKRNGIATRGSPKSGITKFVRREWIPAKIRKSLMSRVQIQEKSDCYFMSILVCAIVLIQCQTTLQICPL